MATPVGSVKVGGRYENDPNRRVQDAIALVFDKIEELETGRHCCGSMNTASTYR
ncbi:hypothetical protein [Bradyrhizobium macuxiense]|uniref:hypothetical protein n=1 Tax=Bradyrhizobium macuxiense TaxID=1755647 RepID=UPI00142EC8C6|nr:hypothetical protein [Bradyrhizobium macuxiense]